MNELAKDIEYLHRYILDTMSLDKNSRPLNFKEGTNCDSITLTANKTHPNLFYIEVMYGNSLYKFSEWGLLISKDCKGFSFLRVRGFRGDSMKEVRVPITSIEETTYFLGLHYSSLELLGLKPTNLLSPCLEESSLSNLELEFKVYLSPDVEEFLTSSGLRHVKINQFIVSNDMGSMNRVRETIDSENPESPVYEFCYKGPGVTPAQGVLEVEHVITEDVFDAFIEANQFSNYTTVTKLRWYFNNLHDCVWTVDKFENGHFVAECEGPTSWRVTEDDLVLTAFPHQLLPYIKLIAAPGKSILSQKRFLSPEVTRVFNSVYGND